MIQVYAAMMSLDPVQFVLIVVLGLGLLVALWLRVRRLSHRRDVVIDGSNVLYWQGGGPRLDPLVDVIAHLRRQGLRPRVVFDANAGHLTRGRYVDDRQFEALLGLGSRSVLVAPKGMQADGLLLQLARDTRAPIVSNDRFRDWAERFPEVRRPGLLIRGGYRDDVLWLDQPVRRVA